MGRLRPREHQGISVGWMAQPGWQRGRWKAPALAPPGGLAWAWPGFPYYSLPGRAHPGGSRAGRGLSAAISPAQAAHTHCALDSGWVVGLGAPGFYLSPSTSSESSEETGVTGPMFGWFQFCPLQVVAGRGTPNKVCFIFLQGAKVPEPGVTDRPGSEAPCDGPCLRHLQLPLWAGFPGAASGRGLSSHISQGSQGGFLIISWIK